MQRPKSGCWVRAAAPAPPEITASSHLTPFCVLRAGGIELARRFLFLGAIPEHLYKVMVFNFLETLVNASKMTAQEMDERIEVCYLSASCGLCV